MYQVRVFVFLPTRISDGSAMLTKLARVLNQIGRLVIGMQLELYDKAAG